MLTPAFVKQRGAATLLVTVVIILLITISSFAATRQIVSDSKSNNSLFFRNKALEAANAGLSALIADILDKERTSTYLNNLDTFTTLKDPDLKTTKYNLVDVDAIFTLEIIKINDDPATGMQRIHAVSTGCYPADCLSGKAVAEQDISIDIKGGISTDWLSVNKGLNRLNSSSINVHNAPQDTAGTGVGSGITNCSDGDVFAPLNCKPPTIIQQSSPDGGHLIDVYQAMKGSPPTIDLNVYYTNWAPTPTAPLGTICIPIVGEFCKETAKETTLPVKRPVLTGNEYFKKYYGTTDRLKIKTGIRNGAYSSPEFTADRFAWIEGDVTMKSDCRLYDSTGNLIDSAGKHIIINGNLTADPFFAATNDSEWGFLYVAGSVRINALARIKGAMAVEGDFNLNGSLQFYIDTSSAISSFKKLKTTSYGGKAGWSDF
jgi:hypothetical protein